MAISTIGGGSSSGGGLVAPAGSKLQVGGYSSTGSYTTPIPGGDYYFVAPAGSKLSCNGTTYPGYIDYTVAASTSGPSGIVPTGNYVRVAGDQQVTVTLGPKPVTARLGLRGASSGVATNYNRNAIRHNGTLYAFPDSSNNVVWTSTDGMAWTSNATTFAIGNCFMVANGLFFAGDTTNTNLMYTSSNGSTWTQRAMPTANIADGKLSAVVYSGSKYVAFFRRAAGNTYTVHTFTSTDAITWTYGAQVSTGNFSTAGDFGIFVAASPTTIHVNGDGYTTNQGTAYSTNGTSWSGLGQLAGSTYYWNAIEYVNGYFVCVNVTHGNGSYASIWYNQTGQTTWTNWGSFPSGMTGTGGVNNYPTGISWDGSAFVVTAARTTQNDAYSIARSTAIGNGWSGYAPFGWTYSSIVFAQGIHSSQYVNGKWFWTAYDYRWTYGNNGQVPSDNFTFLTTGAFPSIQAPGTFGLFRVGDSTVTLN
jgi:hypothetical protein